MATVSLNQLSVIMVIIKVVLKQMTDLINTNKIIADHINKKEKMMIQCLWHLHHRLDQVITITIYKPLIATV